MGMTMTQKILASRSGRKEVGTGEIVQCSIDVAMSHDATVGVIRPFREIGAPKVWDSQKIVVLIDHWTPANSESTAKSHQTIREFVRKHEIENFYDIKEGICHQILPEKGHVAPGDIIVGTDSHTTTAGAFGAFGTGMGYTEMAGVFATGKTWFKVPPTIKIVLNGRLRPWVSAKDVFLYIAGQYGEDFATYKSLEYAGPVVEEMSIDGRMTLCNMAVELGAKNGIIAPDDKTLAFLKGRLKKDVALFGNDPDAEFEQVIELDVSGLDPQVACPDSPSNTKSCTEVEGIKIDQAFIGSCTNGRLEDLRIAASVLKGKKVSRDVRLLVIPASREIYRQAVREGTAEILLDSGAVIMHPTCGPCLGAQLGLLAPGEVCIASTNRNFRGRMGCNTADIYLASPAIVAASAITGFITSPERGQ